MVLRSIAYDLHLSSIYGLNHEDFRESLETMYCFFVTSLVKVTRLAIIGLPNAEVGWNDSRPLFFETYEPLHKEEDHNLQRYPVSRQNGHVILDIQGHVPPQLKELELRYFLMRSDMLDFISGVSKTLKV